MAERQSRRRKKKDEGQGDKPTDEETAIGKHLRFNLATKSTNFMGHKVEYFTGSKAVDMMMDSKWASGKGNTEILFTDRSSVVQYLDRLLQKGMFHRALKVVKKSKKDEKTEREGKKEKKVESKSKKEKGEKKEVKEKSEKEATEKEEETPKAQKAKEGKRKIKLEPTEEQVFRDGNDAYVWIYDPVKPMYYVYGLLLVVGAITVCLFPLWPPWMRAGTYYLSLGGAGIVGTILVLAIVRFILFVLLWLGSIGRLHLWIFPNLLADVGILESFKPPYEYTVSRPGTDAAKENPSEDGEEKSTEEKSSEEKSTEEKSTEEKSTEEKLIEPGESVEELTSVSDKNDEDEDEASENENEEKGDEMEEGSGSSSNQEQREEFEFIEPEEVSASAESET